MAKKEAKKIALSDAGIRDIDTPEKRIEIYDTVQSGMILRVTPTGYKSFAFRYWYDGKTKQRTIGKVGDVSLAEARKKVKQWKRMLSDGLDPIHEKKKNKEENTLTLSEYIDYFKSDYFQRKLKASTRKTYGSRLKKVQNDTLGKRLLKDVTRGDVRKFLKAEAKDHPTNANRIHSILSKVFNEALDDGHLKENPIKGMRKLSEETHRDVEYTSENIKSIWDAMNQEWDPMQSLLKMLLITGQRLGETSRMKWDHIHNGTWTIPISEQKTGKKTQKPHKVPLPNLALNLLKKLKATNHNSEYVFASHRDQNGHLSEFGNVTDRIREYTMLDDFRLHDLRHIVATGMIELEIDFITVGKVLNHKGLSGSSAVTSRYINPTEKQLTEKKSRALNRWAGYLTELTTSLSALDSEAS